MPLFLDLKNVEKHDIWIAASRKVFNTSHTSYTTLASYSRLTWRMTSDIK